MARIVDLKLRAVGVNGLVKLSKMLANSEQDATFRFRALNQQYKPTLMGKFLTTLKLSCNEKGAIMRPLGHKKIRNSLYVTTDPPYGTTACKWDSVAPTSYRKE